MMCTIANVFLTKVNRTNLLFLILHVYDLDGHIF